MAFPTIGECLVCELVRSEEGGKLSLLGFYGITPNVEIVVHDIKLPVGNLAFVFVGNGQNAQEGESYRLSLKIISDTSKTLVIETPAAPFVVPKRSGHRIMLAIGISNVAFMDVGTHHVFLLADGQSVFDCEFVIASPLAKG